MKNTRRGYLPEYEKLFKGENLNKLKEASKDLIYLLNRDYKLKHASKFVQEHYLLREEERLFLARYVATNEAVKSRKEKCIKQENLNGKEIFIDGFNAIIPMESLVSNSPLFLCMDGAVRDMANLKGSYHIIDKTETAIRLILDKLEELKIKKAHIYLDKPVSNSGRLKCLILEISQSYKIEIDIELLDAVDKSLYGKEYVVSGDCVVIDKSISWIPLYAWIVEDYKKLHDVWAVSL